MSSTASRGAVPVPSNSPRVFIYCRVSTADQTTDNQLQEIKAAGFDVNGRRVVTEVISGSTVATERPAFRKLMERMEPGDVLVVTKLDRLGRNAMDVRTTVEKLSAEGIRVHCLALGGADLTSSAGKLIMQVLGAMAEFERDLLVERTQAGLERARSQGKVLGRPSVLTERERKEVREGLAMGTSVSSLARRFKTSRTTIQRLKAA